MNTYSFSDEALQDLDQLCEYIAQTDQRAASRIFDMIRKRARSLAQFPNMGKSYDEVARGLRGVPVRDYIIFYYPREDGIDITRIVNGHRDIELLFSDN